MTKSPQQELSNWKHLQEYRLRWLLAFPDFVFGDDTTSGRYQDDVFRFLGNWSGVSIDFPDEMRRTPSSVKTLRRLQRDVRNALDRLASGKTWDAPQIGATFQVLNGGMAHVPPTEGSVLRKEYKGTDRQVFLAAVGDILKEGWHLIRWCKDPDCQKPFVRTGRQEYHDMSCSQKVRTERFRNK